MKLRGKEIKNFGEPMIIAEIGCNHDGNIELAKKLIAQAREIGCDYAKFQSFDKESLFTDSYCKEQPGDLKNENLGQTIDRLTFDDEDLTSLVECCKKLDIGFASTPVANRFVDILVAHDVDFIKIASFDLNNLAFLEYAASKGKPIILSVGLGTLQEIEEAVEAVFSTGNMDLILLHCAAAYPPRDENIHLRNMDLLREYFGLPVGFSDHSQGIAIPLAAIARGACVIEKHFTYDNALEFGDHPISANPGEMKAIVEGGRKIVKALGEYRRVLSDDDKMFKGLLRRSVVTRKKIQKGDKITLDMIDFKRPGNGIQIGELSYLLNRKAKGDIDADRLISWDDLQS